MNKEEEIMIDARINIKGAIDRLGKYSHNIVSLTLRHVSKELSYGHANSLIDEFELEYEFGIEKCFPDKKKLIKKFQ